MDKSAGLHMHYTYRSCTAMETHVMQLPACADVNARGHLDLCSY